MPHLRDTLARVDAGAPHLLTYDGMDALSGSPDDDGVADAEPTRRIGERSAAAGSACAWSVATRRSGPPPLDIDGPLVEGWLVQFLRDEMARRGFERVVVGVSGGVDSAVTAFLAARAFGPTNVIGVRMPYRTSSSESLEHGQLVIDTLGIEGRTVDISAAVDGYLQHEPDADPARRGNVMARMRMITLFDLSAKHHAIPLGTGNKTERLFGYFTWHADDSPPINPLGDLFKTQVWALARHLGVPEVIVGKAPSADLVVGQTDEGDFGISYAKADELLNWMLSGYGEADLVARGFAPAEVALVRKRLATHALEASPADGGDAQRIGDRGELPAAGGLLTRAGSQSVGSESIDSDPTGPLIAIRRGAITSEVPRCPSSRSRSRLSHSRPAGSPCTRPRCPGLQDHPVVRLLIEDRARTALRIAQITLLRRTTGRRGALHS